MKQFTSSFKDPAVDRRWFESWVARLELLNKRTYTRVVLNTSLGKTQVWTLEGGDKAAEPIVIFPGARTTSLFWDVDRGLDALNGARVFLVETNGLPNLSDGTTPDIKGQGYGVWATEVLDLLGLGKVYIAGASFGGLICMKLAIQSPQRVKAAFLLNPGCLQPFSLSLKNLYYNLLPIFSPTRVHVKKFLDAAIFCKPNHTLSAEAEELLVDYEVFALTRYRDNTQKPYFMNEALKACPTDVYLALGDRDLLFPHEQSAANARRLLSTLKEVQLFKQVGHGIETYQPALRYMAEKMKLASGNSR
jgi:pimeloyl-ACP methyl ester carboxylesterase